MLVNGRAVIVNTQWSTLSEQTPEDAVGDGWWAAVHPEDRDRVASAVKFGVDDDQTVNWRMVGRATRWVRARLGPVSIGSSDTCLMAVIEIDAPNEDVAAAATDDSTRKNSPTGVVDRATFMTEVSSVLGEGADGSGLQHAVLSVDLGRFDDINDRHGH